MSDFIRTENTATEAELRELFDMEPDDELHHCIGVCAGEWRHDVLNVWRFFRNPEWEDDDNG